LRAPGASRGSNVFCHAAYGTNWDRLVQVKQRYDPDNLFRFNHNIAPAG
jgi:FAD/FMN-containing dehydrogenase